jgi:hypothetical protein
MFELKFPSFWGKLDDESRLRVMILLIGVVLIVLVFVALPFFWNKLLKGYIGAGQGEPVVEKQAEQAQAASEESQDKTSWPQLESNLVKLEYGLEKTRELLREKASDEPLPTPLRLPEQPMAPVTAVSPTPQAGWRASNLPAASPVASDWPQAGRRLAELQQAAVNAGRQYAGSSLPLPEKGLRPPTQVAANQQKSLLSAQPSAIGVAEDWENVSGNLRRLDTAQREWFALNRPAGTTGMADTVVETGPPLESSGALKQTAGFAPSGADRQDNLPLAESGEWGSWRATWENVRVLEKSLAETMIQLHAGGAC